MTTALLISTYNWPHALELVFLSVLHQTILPGEILIADDGSSVDTAALVERYRKILTMPVKHIWQEDNGFRKSLILNKVISQTSADYIIEIDGDILMHPKLVEDHIKAARKGFFVQGSRTMLTKKKTEEILKTQQITFSPFSAGIYSRFNAFRIPFLSLLFKPDKRNSFNVKACNLAFWREDYIKVNGYDNDFNGWGWEDYEFAARLINAGVFKKRLKMAAIGYHLFHPKSFRENFMPNELIYLKTLKENTVYCDNGYQEAADNKSEMHVNAKRGR